MKRFFCKLLCLIIALPIAAPAITAFGAEESVNARPDVIPAVREWKGGSGKYIPEKGMSIVLSDKSILTDAQKDIISGYFTDILGFSPEIASGEPSDGDVLLAPANDETLGSEGYTLDAGDTVTIRANTGKGLIYGVITLLQSCLADGYFPRGNVRDVPQYEIRSGMIDVARAYIPLDYVEEITKYYAWFKLNEIHLHINDTGANNYFIFRLESDVPGLTATDGFYSKDDYRAYQKRMLEYGVEVVTEIDTPAHSACFRNSVPELMFSDGHHLDISKPETIQFICNLFDEYIAGDDPVFVSKRVHFGTDEYPEGHNEEMRAYTDALIKHIRSRGYTPRFWGSFGGIGFNGSTPVSGDAECNYWATELSDPKVLLAMGYDIINTCGPRLYCVPGGNYGFADYYDLDAMYKTWFVNYLGYNEAGAIASDNPQLKGACFALWNDRHTEYGGFSMFDIFDRVRSQVCLISEKAWTGDLTRDMSSDDFVRRFGILGRRAGNTNPMRCAELPLTQSDIGQVKSVGFPYMLSADVTLDKRAADANILSGDDGRLYIAPNGKLCFSREVYTFTYEYVFPVGEKVNIKLYADNRQTLLIVNDTFYYYPVNLKNTSLIDSSTFVLPTETVGGGNITVENLRVYEPNIDLNEQRLNANMAFGKTVTVSGLEVDYGILNEPLAVDGDHETRLSFARDKDEQWMLLDLGKVRNFNKIVIDFFEHVPSYEIYVSENGDDFTKIYSIDGQSEGNRQTDTVEFESVHARYIKYVQLKRFFCTPYSTYYSGGICEFEVYGMESDKYNTALAEAEIITSADTDGSGDVRRAAASLKSYLKSDIIYQTHVDGLLSNLENAIYSYNNPSDESSAGQSEAPEASSQAESLPETKKGGISPWVWIGIGAATAAAAAAIIFGRKKKKE